MFALHLLVRDVRGGVDWYQRALNATVTRILRLPGGMIALADLDIGGLPVALAAPPPGGTPGFGKTTMSTPNATATTVAAFRLTVPDADAALAQAVEAGGVVAAAAEDKFWGVRTAEVLDPSGHRWAFDQRLRELADAEIEATLASMLASQ
jgi:PhnB protein